jgi:hypothetical protein
MTTINEDIIEDMQAVRDWALDNLVRAQRMYNNRPTATHWHVCVRAMLVFQQIDWATRASTVDHEALMLALDEAPGQDWGDIICRATLGMSVATALA